jgi:hypothetical protein
VPGAAKAALRENAGLELAMVSSAHNQLSVGAGSEYRHRP